MEMYSGYNIVNINVRLNDTLIQNWRFTQNWGSDWLIPYSDSQASSYANSFLNSNTVEILLDWYGGSKRFKWTTGGLMTTINNKC